MSTISSDQRDNRPTNSRRDLGISLDQVLGTVVPAALYYHECAGTRDDCLSVCLTNLGNPLLSFPQDQDCWSRNDATPSLLSSLSRTYFTPSSRRELHPCRTRYRTTGSNRSSCQYLLMSTVVSATFVYRNRPFASEILTRSEDENPVSHWTTTWQAVVSAPLTFHNHVSASEIVSSQLRQVLASNPQISFPSLSPADGECYQPISTFAYALPTGLHASHSRAPYLSTVYFGQPSDSRTFPLATRVQCH
jgi:hypothetical protein